MSEFTEREDTNTKWASQLSVAWGVKLRAATNDSGTASSSASSVPSVAM
jgi:hypothetical protein